jgi:hypothetical protein
MARRRRHTRDQIIRELAEGNKLLAGRMELEFAVPERRACQVTGQHGQRRG